MTLSGKPNAILTVLINSSQYFERNELIKTLKIFIDYMSGDKISTPYLLRGHSDSLTLSGKPNAILTVLINSSQYFERNELIKTLKIFIDYMSGDKISTPYLLRSFRFIDFVGKAECNFYSFD